MSPLPSLQMPPVRKHGMPLELQPLSRPHPTVADQAEERKKAKYAELATTHYFVLLAVEITGVFGSEAQMFF